MVNTIVLGEEDGAEEVALQAIEDSDYDGVNEYADPDSIDDVGSILTDLRDHGESEHQVASWDIQHSFGDAQMDPRRFIKRLDDPNLEPAKILDMFHTRYSMDIGRRKYGSKPAHSDYGYFPIFHLDMLCIIGRPLHSITSRSGFFDNVTFSLQHWEAPYTSKHIASSLPFELVHRTFRIATAASREIWFIVMQPISSAPVTHTRDRRRLARTYERSSILRHHAEVLASYIKNLFLDGELVGEGVEAYWALNGSRAQSLSYDKWSIFQRLFMEGWATFAQQHAYDSFRNENQPAFHTYDHGANIEIEISDQIRELSMETRLRTEDEQEDTSSEGETSDEEEMRHDAYERRRQQEGSKPPREPTNQDNPPRSLHSSGLERLRTELEQKYSIDSINQISYALAADIHCDTTQADEDSHTVYLLADRSSLTREYRGPHDFTFYPLAFHPRFGNFSSPKPPSFLEGLCTIMQNNVNVLNEGTDALSFGFFQGYSNIKRTIRSRSDDLLATKGIATAALTLPPAEATQHAHIEARQRRFLRQLRGELTPDEPASSSPFARERQRIEAAIEGDQLAFRMEQVVTFKVSRLDRPLRDFHTILQPILQLMRFFVHEKKSYTTVLHSFQPSVFPGVLCSFARLFELAMGQMDQRFRNMQEKGLDVALAEGIAILDRLGHFCFTGDPRVLPRRVLGPLVTMDSLQQAAWPYISDTMLDLRPLHGSLHAGQWPRTPDTRPILLHIAALRFHYGPAVAANRFSQIAFGRLRLSDLGSVWDLRNFLENIFRELWIPQMVLFLGYQWRRRMGQGAHRSGDAREQIRRWERFSTALEAWERCETPFGHSEYQKLFPSQRPDDAIPMKTKPTTLFDFVQEIYEACLATDPVASRAFASKNATWFPIVHSTLQHSNDSQVSRQDWIAAWASAMAKAHIEWVPGSYRKRLTAHQTIRLVGKAQPRQILMARPESIKRKAMEAEERMSLEAQGAKRVRGRRIDFGCPVPFTAIPTILQKGFDYLENHFETRDQGIRNHYEKVRCCLQEMLGDPLCDLLLMFTLTFAASTATPELKLKSQVFSVAKRRREPHLLVVTMVTRMLWFLRRDAFPWIRDEAGVLCVKVMTTKIGKRIPEWISGVPVRNILTAF